MSGISRAAVRLAAGLLPRGIRDRYREEWLGDLESASAEGVRGSGIAVGALVFSATINRDAPEVSGVPLTVTTRRHARWGVALLGASGALGISYVFNGGFAANGEGVTGLMLASANVMTQVAAVTLALLGLTFLWRAALLASTLAKISAALATATVALLFAPLPDGLPFFGAALAGLGAGICGLIAWTAAPAIQTPPAQDAGQQLTQDLREAAARRASPAQDAVEEPAPPPARRLGAVPITVIATIAVLGLFSALALSGLALLLVMVLAVVAIIVTIVIAVTHSRRRAWPDGIRPTASKRAAITVVGFSALLFGLIAFGAVELFIWSPQAMAPDYTIDEIYAALSPADRIGGITMIVFWVAGWALASIIYLVAGLILAARPGHFSPGTFAVIGLTVIAAIVFFHAWAGFAIGNSISDTLPPFVGRRSDLGSLFAMVGTTALVIAVVGLISPPPISRAFQAPDATT